MAIDVTHRRPDLSPLLIHLTRQGPIEIRTKPYRRKVDVVESESNPEVIGTVVIEEDYTYEEMYWMVDRGIDLDEEFRRSAAENLTSIMRARELRASNSTTSIKYIPGGEGPATENLAVCFTETPLASICAHVVIPGTNKYEPYGLAFLKQRLIPKGAGPAVYLNAYGGRADRILGAILSLHHTHPNAARDLIPLLTHFGPHVGGAVPGQMDFRWEREWRYPAPTFQFDREDLFLGLCPHEEMTEFEGLATSLGLMDLPFVDPMRNPEDYRDKFEAAGRRAGITERLS